MEQERGTSRRGFLRMLLTGAGAGVLAACGTPAAPAG